jgi:thioesterase DpgC
MYHRSTIRAHVSEKKTGPMATSHEETTGLSQDEVQEWLRSRPDVPGPEAARPENLAHDAEAVGGFLTRGESLRGREGRHEAALTVQGVLRETRVAFLRAYAQAMYEDVTGSYSRPLRVDALVYEAAERFPGLLPTRDQVEADMNRPLKEKTGVEIDQGIFLSQVLSAPRAGRHLVRSMLLPLPEAEERLQGFRESGEIELGTATLRRVGKAGVLTTHNPRFLNAEDESTLGDLEIAVDLALLDPDIEVGVLRGGKVDHPRYAGRHIFNAGINLTRLYQGQISYLWYIRREMGPLNKIFRGQVRSAGTNDIEDTDEKPWIAAVEAFAIGGGCQLLLVMDHILAEETSFFSLPARKEGIIPGAANLRLPRFVGDRLARQGILFDRRFPANSVEGRLICDGVVPDGEMDAAIERTVAALTGSGVVSAAANRKALRVVEEPLDVFRTYMAVYAREQAYCHFSPALVRNLEENWGADKR